MSSSDATTVIELLDARAAGPAREPAYTFLVDGERDEQTLTFAELAARARAVAAVIREHAEPGARALLLYPPGHDFLVGFFACLYARVIAVPAYPPYRKAELRRLQAIIADAEPALVLTNSALLAPVRAGFAQYNAADRIGWIASDTVALGAAPPAETIVPGDIAFLQYTSGSTGSPKGVMLDHANLLHNAALVHAAIEHGPDDRYVSWLPVFHDMGFMAGVLEPLFGGLPCVQMAPQAFLQRPVRWLQAISRYRATTSGGPNFAYELCLRKVTDEELAALDLSSWTVAFNGAEPVRADTMRRFAERFAAAGFCASALYPCYGLAEATLMVTGSYKGQPAPIERLDADALAEHRAVSTSDGERAVTLVGCGRSLAGQEIAIVDPDTARECGEDRIGEIWVRGGSIAAGYWKRPEESAATFGAQIAGSDRGAFLRTGDLGFVRGSQLFVTGRHKDLMILRGRNHYPQDVELTVERSHRALRPGCVAAFSVDVDSEERLALVAEVEQGETEAETIFAAIRRMVADQHELVPHAIVLVAKGSIHKTSSGKIQRRSCKKALLEGKLQPVASWRANGEAESPARSAEITAWLVAEVARRASVTPGSIDPAQPIAAYGLDSLAAVELAHALQTRFNVEVTIAELLSGISVAAAARRIAPLAAAPTGALSCGQRALWLLHQIDPTSTVHTLARSLRLPTGADAARLRAAFEQLVRRHPSLRTRFPVVDGEPVREELPDDPRVFRTVSAVSWSERELDRAVADEAATPFDLANGPVLRVRHFDRGDQPHVLVVAVHHIVADFWSLVVLLRELGAVYAAAGLGLSVRTDPDPVGYGDFVAWQEAMLRGDEGARLRAHWQQALAGDQAPLELPADWRPRDGAVPAATCAFTIDAATTHALRRLAARHGGTLFGITLAVWQLLLHRLTGQARIVVGTPTSGRDRAELAKLVGYLVNIVPVAVDIDGTDSFGALAARVRDAAQHALAHAGCPFPIIAEASSTRPLVQTLFAFQKTASGDDGALTRLALGLPGARLTIGDLAIESLAAPPRDAEFDLALSIGEADGGLVAALEYRSDRFAPETITAWVDCLQQLLRAVATDPDARIDELPMLSASARHALAVFEGAPDEAQVLPPLPEQLEALAREAPDAPAVLGAWSRADLDREANRIAHHLRSLGVGPESRVAICLTRSPRLIAAMLAAWKCGAAYVPLDPEYPAERVRFVVQDAVASVVITEHACRAAVAGTGAAQVCLDDDAALIAAQATTSPGLAVGPSWAAYVIYTSGSTGTPKGVVIEHRHAAALVAWARRTFSAEERSRVLAATSICFDLSIFEIWGALATGGAIVLAESVVAWWTAAHEGAALSATLVNTVPSALAAALELGPVPDGVRTINLAGEALEPLLVDAIAAVAPDVTVYNLYGPSETTTYSSFTAVRPGERVAIGRPVGATTLVVLDRNGQRAPVGAIGELYIGGPGVARGYGGRPGLTAERFLPDPAGPPGARLYRTGDRVRWRADGQLEFIGRQDHQVKLRGYRIELTEIASVLREHASVLEAVAVVRGAGAHARLVAYAMPRPGRAVDAGELGRHLQERVPRYMVPSPIVVVDQLPRTASGKIDRAALPEPGIADAAPARVLTAVELDVAALCAELLGLPHVGPDDDLFAYGAHSLDLVTLRARLGARFGVTLPLDRMFKTPTVAAIAAVIEEGGAAPVPTIRRQPRRQDGQRQ